MVLRITSIVFHSRCVFVVPAMQGSDPSPGVVAIVTDESELRTGVRDRFGKTRAMIREHELLR